MKKPYVIEQKTYGGGTEVKVAGSECPLPAATLAMEIATRCALIAAIPDGEDSAGRQKLRLPTADELAVRSCEIAAALFAQFQSREWIMDLPAPKTETER